MSSWKSADNHLIAKVVPLLVMFTLFATTAFAELKVVGSGSETRFDPAEIPVNMRQSYQVLTSRCNSCHSVERLVDAVRNGIAPITGQPFDAESAGGLVRKVAGKPDSNINEVEVKEILDVLNFLFTKQAAK